MIGGLQGDFGNLDNKYLKQNIPKCRSKYLEMSVEISGNVGRKYMEASGEHRGTVQIWLQNSPGERYQMIQICVTGEVETLYSPIRRQNSGGDTSGWNGCSRIPKVIHPGGMGVAKFRMSSGWNGGATEFWMSSGWKWRQSIISDVIRVEWRRPDVKWR